MSHGQCMGNWLCLFIYRLCSENIIDFVIYNLGEYKCISNMLASSITFHLYENSRCIYSKMLSFVMIQMSFILMTFNCQLIKLLRELSKLDFAINAVYLLVHLKTVRCIVQLFYFINVHGYDDAVSFLILSYNP